MVTDISATAKDAPRRLAHFNGDAPEHQLWEFKLARPERSILPRKYRHLPWIHNFYFWKEFITDEERKDVSVNLRFNNFAEKFDFKAFFGGSKEVVITDHLGRVHLGKLKSLKKVHDWYEIPYWVGCIAVDGYFNNNEERVQDAYLLQW